MSASGRKKPWVRSAFSQLNGSAVEAVPAKRTRTRSAAAAAASPAVKETETTKKEATPPAVAEPDHEVPTITSDNWIDSFAPGNSDELAVHPKKVGELRDWLRHCEVMRKKYPAQVCLLTGPAGAGKTAALRVLAQEAGYQLQEWINPVDCEVINALGDQPRGSAYSGSQLDAFKSYLLRASRYKSLLVQPQKRLLLIEDFPNVLLTDTAATFEDVLNEYANYGKSPLVFIVADAKSRGLNISYKLFTDQVKAKHRIEHITFNAIAATIMQKSMKRFCSLMREQHSAMYKVPTPAVVDSIVVCAQGDIRNALINLHFASLKGAPSIATQQLDASVSGSKGRKRKAQSTLKSLGRDESITMMHALGRVFNPKFNDDKMLQHSPEELSMAFSTEPQQFTNFIHANYLPHFRDIAHVVPALDDIGLADLLLREYRDDTLGLLGLNIAVRGCMLANTAPVTGWMPVRGPKRMIVQPQATEAEQKLLGVAYAGISKSLYASDYGSLVRCIATKNFVMNRSQI